jgi:hypothetical protein
LVEQETENKPPILVMAQAVAGAFNKGRLVSVKANFTAETP